MKTIAIKDERLKAQLHKVDRARGVSTTEATSWMHFMILDKKGVIFATDKRRAHILNVKKSKELKDLNWIKRPQVFTVLSDDGQNTALTILDEGPESTCKKLVDYKGLFFYGSEDFEPITAKLKGKEVDTFCLGRGLDFDDHAAAIQTLMPLPINFQYLKDITDIEPYKIKIDTLEDPESPVLFEQADFFACIKPFDGYTK